jgi:hypothetical protein
VQEVRLPVSPPGPPRNLQEGLFLLGLAYLGRVEHLSLNLRRRVSLPETEGLILLDELFCALLRTGLAGLALELGGTLEVSTSCCQLLLLFLLSAVFADYLLGYFKLLVLGVCLGMRLKQLRSLLPMT